MVWNFMSKRCSFKSQNNDDIRKALLRSRWVIWLGDEWLPIVTMCDSL